MPNDNVLTDDLRQRCRELLELSSQGESSQKALRALADTYSAEIPAHVRRSMAESQTHREAMRALLATPQPEPRAEVTDTAEAAFEAFAARYDQESNEWLDMDAQQTFIHGWNAARTGASS